MNGPILSIITVNFNNNLGLLKTLESVSSQSFSSYEHIIIDAGSTDGSRETIIQYEKENPHLSFWSSEPDKGIYDGMNKGIDHAKGQYLYFLNSGGLKAKKTSVTVIDRSDTAVSVQEDLSYQSIIDRADRTVEDGKPVMEYVE